MSAPPQLPDYAIVVGIDQYVDPDLLPLRGARKDAERFREWLKNAGVAEERILPRSPGFNYANNEPRWPQLDSLFKELSNLYQKRNVKGGYLGRRLYVFLSGHGCNGPNSFTDVRLLTAESSINERVTLPVMLWVKLFFDARVFREIVVFLDCCRTIPVWAQRELPLCFTAWLPNENGRECQFHVAFGCRYDGRCREHPWSELNGEYQGVFTRALLEKLEATVRSQLHLTTPELKSYLRYRVPKLWEMANEERKKEGKKPLPPQEPTFEPEDFDFTLFEAAMAMPA